ncbi:MAG: alpha/beta fold hydrolase [Parvularculaceae bacterium]
MKFLILIIMTLAALVLVSCSTGRIAERDPVAIDPDYPPAIIEISFLSHGDRLNGFVYLANGPGPHPTVLLMHGYPGTEKNLDIAQYLRRDGWNVLFFHYRGAWGSEGAFSFLNAAEDTGAALNHLRDNAERYRADPGSIAIVGHSMGGQMTLVGAANDPEITCAATLAAASIDYLMLQLEDENLRVGFREYADSLTMLAGHDGGNVIEQGVAFADRYPLADIVFNFAGKKLLLLAAENDEAVPVKVHEAYVAAFSKSPDVELDSEIYVTDHSFNSNRIAISRRLVDWLDANCR